MSIDGIKVDFSLEAKIDNLLAQAEQIIENLKWKSQTEQARILKWSTLNKNYCEILDSIFNGILLEDFKWNLDRFSIVKLLGEKFWLFLLFEFLYTEGFFEDSPSLQEEVGILLFEFWEVTQNLEYTWDIKRKIQTYRKNIKTRSSQVLQIERFDLEIEKYIEEVLSSSENHLEIIWLFYECIHRNIFTENELIDFADIWNLWKISLCVILRRILHTGIKISAKLKIRIQEFLAWNENELRVNMIHDSKYNMIEIEFLYNIFKQQEIWTESITFLLSVLISWFLDNNNIMFQKILDIIYKNEDKLSEEQNSLFYNYLADVYEITPLPHNSSPS